MSQSSFTDPKTIYSLYCTGCFQSIWFQGLSSLSVFSVSPDLQGTHVVLLPSHLYLQRLRHPLQVPKPWAPNNFTKIKESIRVNVASAHKIFNITLADTSGVSINLDLSNLVVRYFYRLLRENVGFIAK